MPEAGCETGGLRTHWANRSNRGVILFERTRLVKWRPPSYRTRGALCTVIWLVCVCVAVSVHPHTVTTPQSNQNHLGNNLFLKKFSQLEPSFSPFFSPHWPLQFFLFQSSLHSISSLRCVQSHAPLLSGQSPLSSCVPRCRDTCSLFSYTHLVLSTALSL